MIYLIGQTFFVILVAAVLGFALGWLMHRRSEARRRAERKAWEHRMSEQLGLLSVTVNDSTRRQHESTARFAGGLDEVAEHIGRLEARVEGHRACLETVDERLDGVPARFARIDERLDGVPARFDALEVVHPRLSERLQRAEAHLAERAVETRALTAANTVVDARLAASERQQQQTREDVIAAAMAGARTTEDMERLIKSSAAALLRRQRDTAQELAGAVDEARSFAEAIDAKHEVRAQGLSGGLDHALSFATAIDAHAERLDELSLGVNEAQATTAAVDAKHRARIDALTEAVEAAHTTTAAVDAKHRTRIDALTEAVEAAHTATADVGAKHGARIDTLSEAVGAAQETTAAIDADHGARIEELTSAVVAARAGQTAHQQRLDELSVLSVRVDRLGGEHDQLRELFEARASGVDGVHVELASRLGAAEGTLGDYVDEAGTLATTTAALNAHVDRLQQDAGALREEMLEGAQFVAEASSAFEVRVLHVEHEHAVELGAAQSRITELAASVQRHQDATASEAERQHEAVSVSGRQVDALDARLADLAGSADAVRARVGTLEVRSTERAQAIEATFDATSHLAEALAAEVDARREGDQALQGELTTTREVVRGIEGDVDAAAKRDVDVAPLRDELEQLQQVTATDRDQIAAVGAVTRTNRERIDQLQGFACDTDGRLVDLESRGLAGTFTPADALASRWSDAVSSPPEDDLTEISGIGPVIARTLHELGVRTFAQLAAFGDDDVTRVSKALPAFSGRIVRDKWVEQAQARLAPTPAVRLVASEDRAVI